MKIFSRFLWKFHKQNGYSYISFKKINNIVKKKMKGVETIFVFQGNVVIIDNTPSKLNKNTIIIYITKKGGEC